MKNLYMFQYQNTRHKSIYFYLLILLLIGKY